MNEGAANQLLKGLEEEVYAGEANGKVVGLSPKIAERLDDFTTEPDSRNIESITDPHRSYDDLTQQLYQLRQTLRCELKKLGPYTLVPGGSLSLGNSKEFLISKPDNPYYAWIRDHYWSNIVTTSAHINIGIDDPESLMRCYRMIRLESTMFLALSASSPFLDGKVSGFHSTRWSIFPKTPKDVPFFKNHEHFKLWVKQKIEEGEMQNKRHLWLALRPNGHSSPDDINRLELRICDHTHNIQDLIAITAFLESRVWHYLENPDLDLDNVSSMSSEELEKLCLVNEEAVSKNSLDAKIIDWKDGSEKAIRDLIEPRFEESLVIAERRGFKSELSSLRDILISGNTAQKWLKLHEEGQSIKEIITMAIKEMEEHDSPCMLT